MIPSLEKRPRVLKCLSIGTPARRNVRRIDTDYLKKSMIPIATQKYFFLRVGGNVCNSAFVKNMQVGATVLPIPKKTDRVLASIRSCM